MSQTLGGGVSCVKACRKTSGKLRGVVDESSNEDDKRPASRRIADELRSAIVSGTYPMGTALPPYRQIAADYHVAVNTAMAAVRLLRDEGLVTGKPNAANYVRDQANDNDAEHELRALRAELRDLQTQVRQAGSHLAIVEARLSEVVARLSSLESR